MKEVTQDEFYKHVGDQDACVRVLNEYKWPYTILFELRHSRKLIGKVVESYTDGIEHRYPIVKQYLISA